VTLYNKELEPFQKDFIAQLTSDELVDMQRYEQAQVIETILHAIPPNDPRLSAEDRKQLESFEKTVKTGVLTWDHMECITEQEGARYTVEEFAELSEHDQISEIISILHRQRSKYEKMPNHLQYNQLVSLRSALTSDKARKSSMITRLVTSLGKLSAADFRKLGAAKQKEEIQKIINTLEQKLGAAEGELRRVKDSINDLEIYSQRVQEGALGPDARKLVMDRFNALDIGTQKQYRMVARKSREDREIVIKEIKEDLHKAQMHVKHRTVSEMQAKSLEKAILELEAIKQALAEPSLKPVSRQKLQAEREILIKEIKDDLYKAQKQVNSAQQTELEKLIMALEKAILEYDAMEQTLAEPSRKQTVKEKPEEEKTSKIQLVKCQEQLKIVQEMLIKTDEMTERLLQRDLHRAMRGGLAAIQHSAPIEIQPPAAQGNKEANVVAFLQVAYAPLFANKTPAELKIMLAALKDDIRKCDAAPKDTVAFSKKVFQEIQKMIEERIAALEAPPPKLALAQTK
jgi:hypothetical protein